jgi:hypothetical protein
MRITVPEHLQRYPRLKLSPAEALVVASPFVVLVAIVLYVGYYVEGQLRPLLRDSACQDNVRILALAMRAYATEHEDHFPPADAWPQAVVLYLPEQGANEHGDSAWRATPPLQASEIVYSCPFDKRKSRQASGPFAVSYTMNCDLGGLRLGTLKEAGYTVLVFDGLRVAGGVQDADARHPYFAGPKGPSLWGAFADGSSFKLGAQEFPHLRMMPQGQ